MRFILVCAALVVGCAERKPVAPQAGPKPTTVGERIPMDFAALIDAPPVALKAGGELQPSVSVCGGCHQAQLEEWRASSHARALEDLQFVAEVSKPSSPRWLCLNCHIPLQQQRPYLVQASTRLAATKWDVRELVKVPNPDFRRELVEEAISCAACHVRRDADGKGTVIGPRGGEASPHRVKKDPDGLSTMCLRCHDPGPVTITPQFFCWFETSREIKAGRRSDETCVDCHMPEAERPPALGRPATKNRQHLWRGGGPPKDKAQPFGTSALEVRSEVDAGRVLVLVTNARSAHMAPSADPERHYLVDVRQLDAGGDEVARDTFRIGQVWDWGDEASERPAKKLTDNRIAPLESRALEYRRDSAAVRVIVDVKHVRLTPSNLTHMKGTEVHAELRATLPGAAAKLLEMEKHYPLFRYVYRAEHDVASKTSTEADEAALIKRSLETLTWDVARLERELGGGH
jgi:nitrate reductase cytochrome c-type subunit